MLTTEQLRILEKLAGGHHIAYSRDGDCGWISGDRRHLDDKDIWALRNRQFIIMESDERNDDYDCDKISSAGRNYLNQQQGETT